MLCTNCLEIIADDSVFCSKCGAKQVRKVICANCHTELAMNDKFCRVCGMPVQKIGVSDEPNRVVELGSAEKTSMSVSDFDTLNLDTVNLDDMPINSREAFAFITSNMQLYPFFKIKKTA